MYSSNCKMYFFKSQNVFVQIEKCVCKGVRSPAALFRMRPIVWAQYPHRLIICPNFKMYLTKLLTVFAQMTKYIFTNDYYVFVQIENVQSGRAQYPHHLIIFSFRSKNKYCLSSAGSYVHLQIFHQTLKMLRFMNIWSGSLDFSNTVESMWNV